MYPSTWAWPLKLGSNKDSIDIFGYNSCSILANSWFLPVPVWLFDCWLYMLLSVVEKVPWLFIDFIWLGFFTATTVPVCLISFQLCLKPLNEPQSLTFLINVPSYSLLSLILFSILLVLSKSSIF